MIGNIRCFSKYKFFTCSGALALTAQIVRNEGPLGLYRGFVSTCTREVGGYFFFFGGYQLSKRLLTPKGKTVDDLGKKLFIYAITCGGSCFSNCNNIKIMMYVL